MTRTTVAMFLVKQVTYDRRVLREAASLVEAGYAVTIYAMAPHGQSAVSRRERSDGTVIVSVPMPSDPTLLRNHRSEFIDGWRGLRSGSWNVERAVRTLARAPWWTVKAGIASGYYAMHRLSMSPMTRLLNMLAGWGAWAGAAAAVAPPADIYHGHDLAGIRAALVVRGDRPAPVIYDVHDLFTEAGSNANLPASLTRYLSRLERRAYRRASLVVTVNDGLAGELTTRYGSKPIAIVHNCVPRWSPPAGERRGPLRALIGVGPDVPLALYHGGFSDSRGLDRLIAAMGAPGLEAAHLALLGFGPIEPDLRRLAAQSGRAGRIHVLPPVDPDVLDEHVADADVSVMVNQPLSRNELLSTPNKLFESIAAGVPVVTSDFPLRRRIVLGNPEGSLGAVCDPTDPASIACAIRSILELSRADRAAIRDRCLLAAKTRWNWEHEAEILLSAYVALGQPARDGTHRAYSGA